MIRSEYYNGVFIQAGFFKCIQNSTYLMELTKIKAPKHVVGKSLCPILWKQSDSVRNNVLTRWRNGYSLKTSRYRITQWGEDGNLGYELYDHKLDGNELNNLAEKKRIQNNFRLLKNCFKAKNS